MHTLHLLPWHGHIFSMVHEGNRAFINGDVVHIWALQ